MAKKSAAVISCLSYSFASITMVILNKMLISTYDFSLPTVLLMYQNTCAVVLLTVAKSFGLVEFADFDMAVAKKWLPVNLVFVGMLLTGFFSLGYLAVPMVTVFKNMANILVVTGEYYILGEDVTKETIASLVLIVIASVCGAAFDLEFHAIGYFWMMLNCCCTAAYVLYMRWASQTVKLTRNGMVFYNNILSLPVLLFVVMINGELAEIEVFVSRITFNFFLLATFSGVIGFSLSFASFWCVGATSATTYAVVGAMNKIPLTVISLFLFNSFLSAQGALAVLISLLGGLMYSYSKIKQKADKNAGPKGGGSTAGDVEMTKIEAGGGGGEGERNRLLSEGRADDEK